MPRLFYRVDPHGLEWGFALFLGDREIIARRFRAPVVLRVEGWRYAIRELGLVRAILNRGFAY